MKKLVKLLFLPIIFLGVSFSASAQIYVKVRPVAPVIIVTPQPSHTHVWIGEEWEPYNDGYRYSGGHWDNPPHEGDRWNNGHWRNSHHRGNEWVPGGWYGNGPGPGHGNGHGRRRK